ncbi:PAAR domain-containing protein [Sulfitobacter sp. F26204]|uniref:PAAR domain-containing protein n=1 Tax=Sulfitobacter sp. F26204 TaxID=2996014 RepID=UPI002B21CB93|nr:PAAR domain-containing protein [Sulfitobacter sp. F26204]
MPFAARMTDLHGCLLPATPPGVPVPPPGVPLPIMFPCAVVQPVLIGKLPAARATDMTLSVPPHPVVKGSTSVLIGKLPAARAFDSCLCGGFVLPPCCPNVMIGG